MVKILFCGLGSIGQRHLRNLLKMQNELSPQPDCGVSNRKFIGNLEILAYRARGRQITLRDDLTVEEGVSVEEKYNIRTFTSLDEALSEQPDAVFITNPMSLHTETLKAVLDKTTANIYVEKPLAHTMDDLANLSAKAKEKQVTVFVGFQNRFHPCIKQAKKLIDSGRIGDIIAANIELGEYMPATRKYEDYRESCAVKKNLGGGVILAQTHEIDYACLLFGKPKSVYAVGGKLSHLEIDVEDTASILLRCGGNGNSSGNSNSIANANANSTANSKEFPVHIHMDFLQNPTTRTCKIIGTHGKIEFDLIKPRLVCYDETGTAIIEDDCAGFVRNDMFIEALDTFFAICRGEKEPTLDMDEGMQSLEVALAAKESMEKHEIVRIDT